MWAAAQALADQAGLSNLQLVQDSFSQLRGRDLPPMDFIVLHGVYSWVNADNRAHIVALIARLLKPGGVVYLSYNCMPGWAHKAPLQRLMSEAAQRQSRGSALQCFHAARHLLRQLDAADAAFFANNPGARTALRDIANASDAYLLHEFAPAAGHPSTAPMSPPTWPAPTCNLPPLPSCFPTFHNGRYRPSCAP